LSGASLYWAQLQGASLNRAQLQGARLNLAQLQGASLMGAQLQGARLDLAQLQGARLIEAQMQGAQLDLAQMQGAWLDGAQMQGAWLDGAQLQGAALEGAQLQGASLRRAELQGASLGGAQLQGAWLGGAQLQGALITGAQLWRLRAPNAALDDAQLRDLRFQDAPPCPDRRLIGPCPTPRNWQERVQAWTDAIPAGQPRERAAQRLSVLTAPQAPDDAEAEGDTWDKHPAPAPEAVANRLGALACGADHAPHIARGILPQISSRAEPRGILSQIFRGISPQIVSRVETRGLGTQGRTLAERMLGDDCPGAKGLTNDERATLAAIAAGRD
jgi:hypothetical protein